ncbi:MAG: site-specific integrase [Chitinispirillia bacterium]|nr:site-specific integrase [Chitinispirillia bacterium]MCL2241328.1 site-specific integrase [Chitinispirillia bacterium]
MALTKIGPNKWHIRCQVWDNNKGYPISKRVTVAGTRAEAVVVDGDILKELKARTLTSAYASTFAEAVDLYMENLRLRGQLSRQHENMVKFVRRELGHIRLEVFDDHFEIYRRRLISAPTKQGKSRKSASINRYTAIVRATFKYLVGRKILDQNPITAERFPKMKEEPRDRYLGPEERLRLLNAIREHRPHILPIVQYMLMVPCRVSELVTAKREQYSPIAQIIKIPRSKAGIPITKSVPACMREYFRNIPADCPWLFYQELAPGEYRPLTHLRYAWAFCLKKAEIADMRIHDLRHIAVTDLYDAGNSEWAIAAQAGWKSPVMMSTYWHMDGKKIAHGMRFGDSGHSNESPTADFLSAVG